jgi:hypothetical protein
MQIDTRRAAIIGGAIGAGVAAPLGVYVDCRFQGLSQGGFDPGFSSSEAIGVFGAAGLGAAICGTTAAAALHPAALVRGRFHIQSPRDALVMSAAIAFGAAGVGANWISESLRDSAVQGRG